MNNRELDKEVATKIFKLAVVAKSDDFYITRRGNFSLKPVPKYSSDLDSAHVVLMAMRDKGFSYNVGSKIQNNKLIWVASFHPDGTAPIFHEAGSLSAAICLAALEAKSRKHKLAGLKMLDSSERIISIEDYRNK
jgi:hypothetical protein